MTEVIKAPILISSNSDNCDKSATNKAKIEALEIDLLCEAIYRCHGVDFRHYSKSSLGRRVNVFLSQSKFESIGELQHFALHDKSVLKSLLLTMSVTVTSMFRNPDIFNIFRKEIIPILRTYPYLRIWHAGCSTGEEAYSMAILLQEEGFAGKFTIYATDMNEVALKEAKLGIYPISAMQENSQNYSMSGGLTSLSNYYSAKFDNVIMSPELKKHIVFAKHNLATDGIFNEFNVVLCRNVMIYFDEKLQSNVHKLLFNSLCKLGVLMVGDKESIRLTPHEKDYKEVNTSAKIYRRIR